MGFKEVASLDADFTTAIGGKNKKTGKPNPKSVEGYFLGSRTVESKKGKNGTAKIHFFQTNNGNLGVWGKTDLDRKISTVAPGSMVRVTHTGMQATPNGEMYKYKVEVDADNAIDVSSLAGSEESSDSGGGGYEDSEETSSFSSVDDEDSGSSEDEEDAQQDAAALAAAAKAQSDRKARVQGLLKGKKA